jgi:hypothetical protein
VGPSSKFAWATFDAPGRDLIADGTDPETAVSALAPGLLAGAQATLLLEAPISVPVPDGQPLSVRDVEAAHRVGEVVLDVNHDHHGLLVVAEIVRHRLRLLVLAPTHLSTYTGAAILRAGPAEQEFRG